MKKAIILNLLLLTSLSTFAKTENDIPDLDARAAQITERVEEIKSLDFSSMDRAERKAIKNEIKSIKKEIKTTQGLDSKVSISVGAIIIILLILIIIL